MKPIYKTKLVTLYQGKVEDVFPKLLLPKTTTLVVDPPYGIGENVKKQASRSVLAKQKDYGEYNWDTKPADTFLHTIIRACRSSIIFGGNYFCLPPTTCWLVWDKDNGKNDFADCELAWTNLKKAVRRIKWRWQGMLQEEMGSKKEVRYHPTQKPLGVMRWVITHVPKDSELVFDPYCGSGSTLIAAKESGIPSIGIDNCPRSIETTIGRLTGKLPLINGTKTK